MVAQSPGLYLELFSSILYVQPRRYISACLLTYLIGILCLLRLPGFPTLARKSPRRDNPVMMTDSRAACIKMIYMSYTYNDGLERLSGWQVLVQ